MFFTEIQFTGITSAGQLLQYLESWDNKESRHSLDSLLLSFSPSQRCVGVWNDSNYSFDERVQFFIFTNSKLELTRINTFCFKWFDVFPAGWSPSAVKYSRMVVLYTVAVMPTHQWLVILGFRHHEYGQLRTASWLSVSRKPHLSWPSLSSSQPCHQSFQIMLKLQPAKQRKS